MKTKAYNWFYAKTCDWVLSRKAKLFADIVILGASGYLVLKKAYGISISQWLLDNYLHENGVKVYVIVTGGVLMSAIAVKILVLVFENIPPKKHSQVEPGEISDCLQSMNDEIVGHLTRLEYGSPVNIRELRDQHSFDVNVRLIVDALSEHITKCINSIQVRRKDLFISLYSHDPVDRKLIYKLHYDPKRDLVASREIGIDSKKFESYECVKCMKSSNSTVYLVDTSGYVKGNSRRYGTVKHYMGCKLEAGGESLGFLNIEFHNNDVFMDEESMQDFMEENIFPFKLLLEYQYLKHQVFQTFAEFNDYWRVS